MTTPTLRAEVLGLLAAFDQYRSAKNRPLPDGMQVFDVEFEALRAALAHEPEPPRPPQIVKCPVCDGTGLVSKPPHIAGDQATWVSTSVAPYPCRRCQGIGTLTVDEEPREAQNAEPVATGGAARAPAREVAGVASGHAHLGEPSAGPWRRLLSAVILAPNQDSPKLYLPNGERFMPTDHPVRIEIWAEELRVSRSTAPKEGL